MLDFATCTECGRCQSQCPAWNTGKPLSPKLVMMDLRDHLFAKAPYLIGGKDSPRRARSTSPPPAPTGIPPTVMGASPSPASDACTGQGRSRPTARSSAPPSGRGDRPGRAVVVHHLRGVRGAVPGRHRARRPHRRHAPLPGDDRVGVPLRARRAVPQPGEQGQPLGAERPQPARLDQEPALRGPRLRRRALRRHRVPVLGRLRGRVRRQGAEDGAGGRGAAAPRRAWTYVVLGPEETCTGDPARRLGQRVPVPDDGRADQGDPRRRLRGPRARDAQDRHDVPALLQHPGPGVPAAGGALRGRPPHAAARHAGARGQAGARGRAGRRNGRHLPRPVLPGPAQRGLRRAPRPGRRRRRHAGRDAPARRPLVLLRRRRGADVDGGEDRAADQPGPGRRGPVHRRGDDRHRLPVLPGHALRRADPAAERRAGHARSRSSTSPSSCSPR